MDASQSKLEVFLFITTLLGFIYPIVSSPRGAVYLLSNVKVLNTLYLYWRPLQEDLQESCVEEKLPTSVDFKEVFVADQKTEGDDNAIHPNSPCGVEVAGVEAYRSRLRLQKHCAEEKEEGASGNHDAT